MLQQIDLLRDQKSNIKTLKMVLIIEKNINQLTVDTNCQVSLLNWANRKQINENCRKSWFNQAEKLSLAAQFLDYIKQPIIVWGASKSDLRSADVRQTEQPTQNWVDGQDL